MVEDYELDELDSQLSSLQNSIVGTTQVSAAFQSGLENMKSSLSETDQYLQGVSNSFNSQLGTAYGSSRKIGADVGRPDQGQGPEHHQNAVFNIPQIQHCKRR